MKRGFTLVELLIVVIILGILASVVIPQFSEARDDPRTSTLITNLQIVRGQIELYHLQQGAYPLEATFANCLTAKTGAFGPYFETLPTNPFNNKNDVGPINATLGSTGWKYDMTDGTFRANDNLTHSGL